MNTDKIPQGAKDFAKQVVESARAHRIRRVSMNLNFEYSFASEKDGGVDWPHTIQVTWEQGRHGEYSDINLTSEVTTRLKETTR